MARKNGRTPDDLEYSSRYENGHAEVGDYSSSDPEFDTGDALDSARLLEAEPEQQSPFLRAQKRVPVRRGPLPKKTMSRVKTALLVSAGVLALAGILLGIRHYGLTSRAFLIQSSDQIQITGNHNVASQQILDVFGADISRNVFAVPLEERRLQLEKIPWIESASVMRFLPNRVAVDVKERTPVAFVQMTSRIALIDASGIVMDIPTTRTTRYSFPVLDGFSDSEPLSTRAARMQIYNKLIRELDSGGARYSQDLSEVDVTDPEDVKITVTQGGVVVHLGDRNYLDRYKTYVSHRQQWLQRFGTIRSVDLRYEGQVVVDPGSAASEPPAPAAKPHVQAAKTDTAKHVRKPPTSRRTITHAKKR